MKKSILVSILSLFFITILKAQERQKDTLFFKLDGNYIYESTHDPKVYLLRDNLDIRDGAIFLKHFKIVNNVKPKEILCFKKFARSAKLYNKNDKRKLNEYKIIKLFNNHVVILVNPKKVEYIQVGPVFEIE